MSSASTNLGNLAIGYRSQQATIDQLQNTTVGYQTFQYGQGPYNTAIGYKALNTSPSVLIAYKGVISTASGLPLAGNTEGDSYVARDTAKLHIWQSGGWVDWGVANASRNVAVGDGALRHTRTKSYSVGIGYLTAYGFDSDYNTLVGAYSGFNGTTGDYNSSLGAQALYSLTTGAQNAACGYSTLYSLTTNGSATAFGYMALYSATGSKNTAFGHSSGSGITSGAKNVVIGSYTGSTAPISATGSNYIVFSDGDGVVRGFFDGVGGGFGVGTTSPMTGFGFRLGKNITGAVSAYAMYSDGTIQSDVTSVATGFATGIGTAVASFTLSTLIHYSAGQATIGAGSTVTSQYGFFVGSSLTGATSNYAFYGALAASGSTRWNLYMGGTAPNYLAGNLGIGATEFGASAAKVLAIGNGTAPSSSPTGVGQLYVESGALKYRGAGGTVTTIANS
jgi:hypothetical protein